MQDETLKNDIISALEWEPDIDLGAAGVSVIEGLVTLFGRVSTARQRDAVERAVLRVRGVAMVTNEIEVAASRSERLPHRLSIEAPGKRRDIDILSRPFRNVLLTRVRTSR